MSSINNIEPAGRYDKHESQFKEKIKNEKGVLRHKATTVDSQISKMIEYINSHRDKIEDYEVVLETVKGVGQLEKIAPYLKRDDITKQVFDLTNMSIHAAENYPKASDFQRTVSGFADKLRDLYSQAVTEKDKNRLFEFGLSSKGCFEARLETLMSYDVDSHSLYGKLKYEIMERNKELGNPIYEPISIKDLNQYLTKTDFLKKNRVDPESFNDLPEVAELIDKGFIKSTKEASTTDKINDALSIYEGFGSGKAAFKKYLLKKTNFSQEEKNHIDKWIDEFIKIDPERAQWI